ncbi:RagB/SusD family nutrient uptake outer membrane protein [Parapedobacter sp. 10938]|uniref:RagB/SusD family nutrient uptake outer membrane protein n=1 Tax=Parapedobacter flavus TaxID=3110225 RepID=UPI002DBC9601|nr:RagB/SusD family nutrient uptake outer membrane protein [Parapedobacter sp. 10938]MEC3880125.1 RagB/SusD family nutrient uptake outer membrane protein [Parapedobacter sp. 10938]
MKRLSVFLSVLLLAGCSNEGLLDSTDLDELTSDKVFTDAENTRKALYNLYGNMRDVRNNNSGSFSMLFNMNVTVAMLDNATDDGAGNTTRNAGVSPGIQKYITGSISGTSNPLVTEHPWNFFYRAIRNANIFLAHVDQSPLPASEKQSSANQARFLRAYFYHELFRWFGPLVISMAPEDPFAFDTVRRETLQQTVRFIANEFDALSAEGALPDQWDGADYGRVTRTAAMAYKARTLLYAASPLFQESGVTWAEAAAAAEELITYADATQVHRLYVAPGEAEKSYTRYFNERNNPENILVYLRAPDNDLYNLFPAFNPWNVNKELTTVPTQWLVDAYDMADGTEPITGYNADYSPIINPLSGYDEQDPYANRDPRFYQTILHHGATWPSVNKGTATVDLTTPNNWGSGYFLVKYLDDRIDHRDNGKTSMNFIMMRYAEVLLNYAEAVNESLDDASARQAAVEQLNRIRARAGITTPLSAADYTQATLRERIRKERRVELCFEEHRFFDIRRWQIAHDVMNRPAIGIDVENGKFVRKVLDQRSYNKRMNLSPVPVAEVNNAPLIYQNPGY